MQLTIKINNQNITNTWLNRAWPPATPPRDEVWVWGRMPGRQRMTGTVTGSGLWVQLPKPVLSYSYSRPVQTSESWSFRPHILWCQLLSRLNTFYVICCYVYFKLMLKLTPLTASSPVVRIIDRNPRTVGNLSPSERGFWSFARPFIWFEALKNSNLRYRTLRTLEQAWLPPWRRTLVDRRSSARRLWFN